MSTTPQDRLYRLLPSVYRIQDSLNGEPLRALLAIIEREVGAVEEDIGQLYDNWFIETCQEWVVPYIGDLLKVRDLVPVSPDLFSQRGYVANSLAYRRRKGTATMLEQLARDVTGWPARVVEFFERLGTTQYLNHPRLDCLRTPNLRDANAMELMGTPFEAATRTADVRHIDNQRGMHNLPNVGIFLWRLEAYPVVFAPPAEVRAGTEPGVEEPGFYRFNVLGSDTPLFNLPQSETVITTLAEEINVPGRLRRRPLYDELEALRAARHRGETPAPRSFGAAPPFHIFWGDEPVDWEQVVICDLSTWHRPPPWPHDDGRFFVAVDPVTGRLAFPADRAQLKRPHVSYAYGFSSEVGGGFYDRQETLPSYEDRDVFQVAAGGPYPSVKEALKKWSDEGMKRDALIEILDSERYPLEELKVLNGRSLELRATNLQRPVIDLPSDGCAVRMTPDAEVLLSGLLIQGGALQVAAGMGASLELRHCTLVPGHTLTGDNLPAQPTEPSLIVAADGAGSVSLSRCISGPLEVGHASTLRLEDCIVDGLGSQAIRPLGALPGSTGLEEGTAPRDTGPVGKLFVVSCTVLGGVSARVLELASNTLFTGPVHAVQRQDGCVRFSYVAPGSRVPKRFRCQPAYAEDATAAEINEVERQVRPVFTSERYGDPGYCQLRADADPGIRRGASDEGEMGVFHHLQQPQREANLRASLTDYLRFGLEAGIFFVT